MDLDDHHFSIFMHSVFLFCIFKPFFESGDKLRFCFSSFKFCSYVLGPL